MTNLPIKITQISKDFDIKSKDVIDTFKELGVEKKSGGSADADEFELFLDHLTKKNQIKDLDAYREGRSKIKSVTEKKEKPKAEAKPEEVAPAPKATPKASETPKAPEAPMRLPDRYGAAGCEDRSACQLLYAQGRRGYPQCLLSGHVR